MGLRGSMQIRNRRTVTLPQYQAGAFDKTVALSAGPDGVLWSTHDGSEKEVIMGEVVFAVGDRGVSQRAGGADRFDTSASAFSHRARTNDPAGSEASFGSLRWAEETCQ